MREHWPPELIESLHQHTTAAHEWIMNRTVGIFACADGGNAVLHGTGVLVQIADATFLLSAAHVLRDDRTMFVEVAPGKPLANLGGEPAIISVDRVDFDIGILRLSDANAAAIAESKSFLRLSDIDLSLSPEDGWYCVVGYPLQLSQNRAVGGTQVVSASPFVYTTTLHKEHLVNTKEGVSIAVTLASPTIGNDGEPLRAPALQGISGCGIWRVVTGRDLSTATKCICLVGIEHAVLERKAIKGVLVHHIVAGLRRLYPELVSAIDLVRDIQLQVVSPA